MYSIYAGIFLPFVRRPPSPPSSVVYSVHLVYNSLCVFVGESPSSKKSFVLENSKDFYGIWNDVGVQCARLRSIRAMEAMPGLLVGGNFSVQHTNDSFHTFVSYTVLFASLSACECMCMLEKMYGKLSSSIYKIKNEANGDCQLNGCLVFCWQ